MDFTQLKQCSGDNIKVHANCKTSAGPGEIVAVTVEVQNNGKRPLSNVIARTFSSAWSLDGKMFYFGMLQPGQKRTFFRLLTMPESKGPCYLRLAFWSVCGVMNDTATNLCINVE